MTQEIKIARWAQRIAEPLGKEHRTFYDEAIAVVCLAEPVEQPFKNIIVEEQVKWLAEAVAVDQLQR